MRWTPHQREFFLDAESFSLKMLSIGWMGGKTGCVSFDRDRRGGGGRWDRSYVSNDCCDVDVSPSSNVLTYLQTQLHYFCFFLLFPLMQIACFIVSKRWNLIWFDLIIWPFGPHFRIFGSMHLLVKPGSFFSSNTLVDLDFLYPYA